MNTSYPDISTKRSHAKTAPRGVTSSCVVGLRALSVQLRPVLAASRRKAATDVARAAPQLELAQRALRHPIVDDTNGWYIELLSDIFRSPSPRVRILACRSTPCVSVGVPCCCMSVPSVRRITWKVTRRSGIPSFLATGRMRHRRKFSPQRVTACPVRSPHPNVANIRASGEESFRQASMIGRTDFN